MAGGLSSEALLKSAYGVANSLLELEPRITQEALESAVDTVLAMPRFLGVDRTRLLRDLEARNNTLVSGYSVIDDKDFSAWVARARENRPFAFWDRYRHWMDRGKRWADGPLRQMDRLTDDILDRLRNPETAGAWDRRGLVVGDVQSGKTSNYTALICKAVDAGFPLVIVLAGVHNSLRSQTQQRLDEGFLGFDTRLGLLADEQENQRIGAGRMPSAPFLVAHSLTSSSDGGDFKTATANGTRLIPGGRDPIILVVKKRVSILENLLAWVLSVRAVEDPTVPGGKIVRDVPMLVIDDEADNASANTNEYRDDDGRIDEDADPTRTNFLIRRLLTSFEKSAYVGYTATPFANVFMHHEARHKVAGEDLFPRSFIINLPAPSNYIGPERVFGLNRPGPDGEARGLPMTRQVRDAEAIFPPGHKKDLQVSELPETLKEAMLAFILACAARRVRRDVDVHNSMLIHVTRLTAVQERVATLVDEHLVDIVRQLEFPGTGGTAVSELEALWRREFASKAEELQSLLSDHDLPPVSWDEVRPQLFDAAKRIGVRQVNGSAKDALDYVTHPEGLSVIAVGGDKLARGLTLEGLSVSYFIRTSRMYDTLMQMGRWFGYRPRYADLCRLYTSPVLVRWYRHIATATAELREEFDLTFDKGESPLEFGHRVRTHPDGMLITAANKMRAGTRVRAGFSGTISETVAFDVGSAGKNIDAFGQFLRSLPGNGGTGRQRWVDVDGSSVLGLLQRLETSRESWKANARALADYVADRLANGRLGKWTVVLVGEGDSGIKRKIGPYEVTLADRKSQVHGDGSRVTIGRLVSPSDEVSDLDGQAQERAMAQTVAAWEKKAEPKRDRPKAPSGPFIRRQRSPERGLLLIYPLNAGPPSETPLVGFAVSFPFDEHAPLIDYAENSVKQLESIFE
ncbi:Z1 domain-containing protein (plasmid) [Agrobacterium salinitolerans]|uniref:Z1 domain-containing protein n=1 Tax=Agrobacterium salinitolerans TaxID=1183413 RepID=UPI001C23F51D|nr:Z1 domain-containing protein [Agrobacterium salinitolerans]QXC52612.1 Z1 domain-containing protein [Agrobacterium salinitolerans]